MQLLTILFTLATVSLALRPNLPIDHSMRRSAVAAAPPSPITLPSKPAFQSVVNPLLAKVDQNQIKTWMTKLTQFPERYYKSQNGVDAAKWIQSTVQALP
ncbi:UNVERIFIED_CONTAM: hypothetical protein HDU68_006631, partial [Siphonaria sp. JEL0065]